MFSLDLSFNELESSCAQQIAQLLSWKTSILQVLDVSNNNIRDRGAKFIATALENNEHLEVLNLSSNAITESGGTSLAKALQHNQSLRSLDLSENPIGGQALGAFKTLLDENKRITELKLSSKLGEVISKKLVFLSS